MGTPKRKTVINAEASHIERVQPLIASGRYKTLSEFAREAMEDKLKQVEEELVAEAVERYCAAGHTDEDAELIEAQAFDGGAASG